MIIIIILFYFKMFKFSDKNRDFFCVGNYNYIGLIKLRFLINLT